MGIDGRIEEMGMELPRAFDNPSGRPYPFRWVRRHGTRLYVSGHLPLNADGTLAEPRGKVGAEVTPEQGYALARQAGLAMLGSLRRELGSLDRVTAWLRVLGMVNAAPGFTRIAGVVNGFSELIVEVFGADVGAHSRSAVGMAELPFGVAVEIEAEVEIDDVGGAS